MTSLAGDRPLLEVDHDSRARIRDDLDRNLFVEAGAGTGKTRVLVDRVVRLVATGAVRDIDNLVAITFTEAAAAELRDRVRRALELAAVDPDLPTGERDRCAVARERLDAATITTLHGFAHRILREYPLDAGLPPAFEVDDEVHARVRFNERWKRFRDELFTDATSTAMCCSGMRSGCHRTPRAISLGCCTRGGTGSSGSTSRRRHCPTSMLRPSSLPSTGRRQRQKDEWRSRATGWRRSSSSGRSFGSLLDDGLEASDDLEIVRVLDTVRPLKPGTKGKSGAVG